MATNSDNGSTGLLGVIIGVILVVALAAFFFRGNLGLSPQKDVNVKVEAPITPTPKN